MRAPPGAILWHQRGARALASTFLPFCLPWDMEIEYHFKVLRRFRHIRARLSACSLINTRTRSREEGPFCLEYICVRTCV